MTFAGDNIILDVKTDHDDERPVYISGEFCNWNPQDENFRLMKVEKSKYQIAIDKKIISEKPSEYIYTKGGWQNVELDAYGNLPINRIINREQVKKEDFVPLWKKEGSTPFFAEFMPIEEVLSEEFYIPQLKRSRKVSVLLPSDYYKNTVKKYPVVYMNDAQNLYGAGSNYGNWEIDKRLSILKKNKKNDVIIVAIDHGDKDRQVEYTPYKNEKNIKGEGMRYATFIVRNLKPLIDSTYRTLPERQFTGIGGSSMGGLISIYTGIMYPESIGRLMVFSPSLWIAPKIYFDAVEFFNPLDTKIYLYGGGKEGASMLPNIEKLKLTIESQGFNTSKIDIRAEIDPDGEHNEKRWGQEFPKALDWMLF